MFESNYIATLAQPHTSHRFLSFYSFVTLFFIIKKQFSGDVLPRFAGTGNICASSVEHDAMSTNKLVFFFHRQSHRDFQIMRSVVTVALSALVGCARCSSIIIDSDSIGPKFDGVGGVSGGGGGSRLL